jgi:hypothetical protein
MYRDSFYKARKEKVQYNNRFSTVEIKTREFREILEETN